MVNFTAQEIEQCRVDHKKVAKQYHNDVHPAIVATKPFGKKREERRLGVSFFVSKPEIGQTRETRYGDVQRVVAYL